MDENKNDIEIIRKTPGYAHTRFEGTCGPTVTAKDIAEKIYHPYFGGRDARVMNGKWSAIRHDD